MRHEIEYLRGLPNGVPRNAPLHVQRCIPIGPLPIQDGLVPIQNGPPQNQNGPPQNQNGLLQIDNGPPPIPVPLAMPVPGAAQGVVHAPVERQRPRRTLKKALDHMQELTDSLKKDSELLVDMEAKHEVQRKAAGDEDSKGIKLLKDRRKVCEVEKKKEGKEAMDSLRAGHLLENPNPTSAQIEQQTSEMHDLHMTHSNANILARRDYDTEIMDLLVEHKAEASELAARQTSEKRAFEDRCLHEHCIAKRARY